MYDLNQIKKLPVVGGKAPAAWRASQALDQAALAEVRFQKNTKNW
jgi:hypothetical protein